MELSMSGKFPRLGPLLNDLWHKSGLSQDQVMHQLPEEHSPRQFRRWQAGETRPPRKVLIHLLVHKFKVGSNEVINDVLDAADYRPLSPNDMPLLPYEPVQVRWGPTVGQLRGIICRSIASPQNEIFVPWDELQTEIE